MGAGVHEVNTLLRCLEHLGLSLNFERLTLNDSQKPNHIIVSAPENVIKLQLLKLGTVISYHHRISSLTLSPLTFFCRVFAISDVRARACDKACHRPWKARFRYIYY